MTKINIRSPLSWEVETKLKKFPTSQTLDWIGPKPKIIIKVEKLKKLGTFIFAVSY